MIRPVGLALAAIFASWPAAAEPRAGAADQSASFSPDDFWGQWTEGDGRRAGVPNSQLPPPGKCRLWRSGLADERQAPPTDCDRAHGMAARDSRAAVLHDDGRLRRSYRFEAASRPLENPADCHLDDPRAACVIDAISRSAELSTDQP
jgi:hypothetical protein